MQTPSVLPFPMFQGDGSAALDFYVSAFPDAQVEEVERYGPDEAVFEDSIRRTRFSVSAKSVLS